MLGKVKQLERDGAADLLVLDAPAAGHAITFLQAARGLLDAVRVGPINTQAREVLEMLNDPARCQVVLVTLPEETPVNELIETAYSLEDKVGVSLGPVVVNGLYPEIDGLDADPSAAADARRHEPAHGRGGIAAARGRLPHAPQGAPARAGRAAGRATAAPAAAPAVPVRRRARPRPARPAGRARCSTA